MKKKGFCLILWLLLSLSTFLSASVGEETGIYVDASNEIGELPYLFRPGVFMWFLLDGKREDVQEKLFSENKIGALVISLELDVLISSKDFDDLKIKLSKIDPLALKVKEADADLRVLIFGMPKWLSSSTSKRHLGPGQSGVIATGSPPKDYEKWSKVVEAIVDHFSNQLEIEAKYSIWAEPNTFTWQGTEEEYLKLYKYSVLGAKRANPKAKIGGPAVLWPFSIKNDPPDTSFDNQPMVYNLIRYCSQTGLKKLGLSRLPIDFVEWHDFNKNPFSPSSWEEPARQIRGWLKQFGYSEDTELFVSEWSTFEGNYNPSNPYASHEHDTEFVAAYIVPTLMAMEKAGIERAAFTTLYEGKKPGQEREFVANYGLFTKSMVTKAGYNAFKALSMMEGKRLKVNFKDPFIAGLATKKDDKLYLLFSSFIPTKKMIKTSAIGELKAMGYRKKDLSSSKIDVKLLNDILSGRVPLETVDLPAELKGYAKKLLDRYKMKREKPESLEIQWTNLPFDGKVKYERYLIDAEHSNAYAVRKRLEEAIGSAKKDARQKAVEYLRTKGYLERKIQQWLKLKRRHIVPKMLSENEQKDLKEAFALYKDAYFRGIDEINEWPQVRLNKVEERTVDLPSTREYLKEIMVSPYSVNLIIISKNE
ncbi:MAG: hypothetical protein HF982_02445 [Desulfobacteraceae bacterium]|nr:hypothetical protein [Desulfobacteraceae bacterium]MBC2718450.1 hypothetical protein [Desulfobacteraceae bacterium]